MFVGDVLESRLDDDNVYSIGISRCFIPLKSCSVPLVHRLSTLTTEGGSPRDDCFLIKSYPEAITTVTTTGPVVRRLFGILDPIV